MERGMPPWVQDNVISNFEPGAPVPAAATYNATLYIDVAAATVETEKGVFIPKA
jgi:hypothetical protein